MDDFTFYHETYSTEFLKTLSKFRDEGLLCDVTITIGKTTFKAHKLVLACFSPYMMSVFEKEELNGEITIQIQDVQADTLHLLLDFAYSGNINISTENVQELLVASKVFDLTTLQERCEEFACGHVVIDNCTGVLAFARKYKLEILKQKALSIIPDDIDSLHDLEMNPDQLLDIFAEENIIFKRNGLPLSKEDRELHLLKEIVHLSSENPEYSSVFTDYIQRMRIPNIAGHSLLETIEVIPKLQDNEIVSHLLQLATLVRSEQAVPEIPPFWTRETKQGNWKLTNTGLFTERTYLGPAIEHFDDSETINPHIAIRRIILYLRPWDDIHVLGGMKVKYDNGRVFSYGLKADSFIITQRCDIKLEEMEWINDVKVNSGWLVDNLILTTNKGRTYGPFGDNRQGGRHDSRPVEGSYNHLHAFFGNVVFEQGAECIRQIGFTWAQYES